MMKKIILCTLSALLVFALASCGNAPQENLTIELKDGGVYVSGQEAGTDTDDAVYVSQNVEEHPDVAQTHKGVENTRVNITRGGVYTITGSAQNTQIVVEAGKNDAVTLLLDGVDISCMTAPAIFVKSALESGKPGEAGVAIELGEGSENLIYGSHIARINDDDVKYDGAVSSAVSITLRGNGALSIDSDNEGIESKKHITVESGKIKINSQNDAINASEDDVSVITVNGGELFCRVSPECEEGDGIDSNGTIVINGGTVLAYANPNSQDSGLDADGGTTVNGGMVLASGNMMDRLNQDSKQMFIQLSFAEKQRADALYTLVDESGKPIAAFAVPTEYTNIQLSVPELKAGNYRLYSRGTIMAENKNGLCFNLTSYSPGEAMQHGGAFTHKEMGPPPEGMEFDQDKMKEPPEGMPKDMKDRIPPDMPKDGNRPERPNDGDMPEMPKDREVPRGKPGEKGRPEMRAEVSEVFELTAQNRIFMNIKPS